MEETIKGKHEMEETIKGIEVIAYKGMKSDMSCKGFQYEIGRSYKTDKVELCECGFHACLNPIDVLYYYPKEENLRYFKVLLSGEITKCDFEDTKVAATEITILEEINIDEIIKTTKWWKNDNVLDLLYWSDGLAKVKSCNYLYNLIDKKGKLLCNEWFKLVGDFHEGFASVLRFDNLMNFIDKDGNYLLKEWFCNVYYFHEGFARVQREDGLYNFIDKNGNILFKEWFVFLDTFHEGFASVKREDGLWNFIDKQGKLLSDEWFYFINDFHGGFASVKRTNGEWCQIDKTGKLIKNLQ